MSQLTSNALKSTHPVNSTHVVDPLTQVLESRFASAWIEASAMLAEGKPLQSALFLRETIHVMQMASSGGNLLESFISLSSQALQVAAARFAVSNPYSQKVDQRIRIDLLEESLKISLLLEDNVRILRLRQALADAHKRVDDPLGAEAHMTKAFELAKEDLLFTVDEVKRHLAQMADVCVAVMTKYSHKIGTIYLERGVKAAGYRFSIGEHEQALADLGSVADRYIATAQDLHQLDDAAGAFRTLIQGIVLKVGAGHSDVLVDYADRLVHFAAINKNEAALRDYERAISLTQLGLDDAATQILMLRARNLLSTFLEPLDLKLFHNAIDSGYSYIARAYGDKVLKSIVQDSHCWEWARKQNDVAFRQFASWNRSFELLESFWNTHGKPSAIGDLLVNVNSVAIKSANDYSVSVMVTLKSIYPPITVSNAQFREIFMGANWRTPTEAEVERVYTQLAGEMDCSVAEVAGAFMPHVDTPLRARLQTLMGEWPFMLMQDHIMHRELKAREGHLDRRWLDKFRK